MWINYASTKPQLDMRRQMKCKYEKMTSKMHLWCKFQLKTYTILQFTIRKGTQCSCSLFLCSHSLLNASPKRSTHASVHPLLPLHPPSCHKIKGAITKFSESLFLKDFFRFGQNHRQLLLNSTRLIIWICKFPAVLSSKNCQYISATED